MTTLASSSLEFALPNATTWSCLSLLLAIALFFKFSRLLSVRNLDVLSLYLLVPGFLLLFDSPANANFYGYLWLLVGSGTFLLRCLFDLTLERRPALTPNLNLGGLAWLALALYACLATVAYRNPAESPTAPVVGSAVLDHAEGLAKDLVQQQPIVQNAEDFDAGFWVDRSLTVLCHLAVVSGLIYVGCRHFQDTHAGMAAATFYLLLPYTAYHVSGHLAHGHWDQVWPMALIIWAVALYRKPSLSGLLLGLAAGTTYFPALAFPLWVSFYGRRGCGRFSAVFALTAGVVLALIGAVLWMDGELPHSLQVVLSLSSSPPWVKPGADSYGFWTTVPWAYCLPVFIAYLAFVCATAFWPRPKNLAHLLALTAAIFLGIQLWYPDKGGIYVLWYLPLLLLLVFRPNLSDRLPPLINRESDWLWRLGRWLNRLAGRLLRLPEPVARVR